jgi:hypothetical protein
VNKNDSRFFTPPKVVLIFISVLTLILTILPKLLSLHYIYAYAKYVLPLIWLLLFIAWIYVVKTKVWLKIGTIAGISIILVFAVPYLFLFSSISGKVYYESVSPSGKNSLVVFEGGFIDANYTAYPKILWIFYQYQDNGFVQKHDFWGGAEINVDWVSDNSASVKVITGDFRAVDGSNNDDIIIVTFDKD